MIRSSIVRAIIFVPVVVEGRQDRGRAMRIGREHARAIRQDLDEV